jgi:hypothetical protein
MEQKDDDAIEVTPENFGELLVAGMREALAIARGEQQPAKVVRLVRRDDGRVEQLP